MYHQNNNHYHVNENVQSQCKSIITLTSLNFNTYLHTNSLLFIARNGSYNAPYSAHSHNRFSATLYFGGMLDHQDKHSLMGGNAWCLLDQNDKRIAHGSFAVQQNFPSVTRLEYEGLLNGLQAALMKNFTSIRVRGSSTSVIAQYSTGRQCAFLGSLYHSISDITTAISSVLVHFKNVQFELITPEMNKFVHKLSKGAITTHHSKLEIKLEKKIAACSAPSSPASTPLCTSQRRSPDSTVYLPDSNHSSNKSGCNSPIKAKSLDSIPEFILPHNTSVPYANRGNAVVGGGQNYAPTHTHTLGPFIHANNTHYQPLVYCDSF